MHPMQPLRRGLGLCPVRTDVAKDEPPAPVGLAYLTEPVVGYVEELSERAPVVYVTAEFHDGEGDQAACGWSHRQLTFGPVRTHHPTRRKQRGAINAALAWLRVPRPLRGDRFAAVGLADRRGWGARGA